MLRCGLASDGVYICPVLLPGRAVVSYTALPPLPASNAAVHFCCTVLGVASTGRYPASLPCEARTFLTCAPFGTCQPRPFVLLTSFAKRILSQFILGFVNLFVSLHIETSASDKLTDHRIMSESHHLESAGNNPEISKAASPLQIFRQSPGSIREQQRFRILLQHRQFIDQRRIKHHIRIFLKWENMIFLASPH